MTWVYLWCALILLWGALFLIWAARHSRTNDCESDEALPDWRDPDELDIVA